VRRLYELDAVRGVAAAVVVAHHISIVAGGDGLGLLPGFAVDLFFALSGFVMARTYEARLQSGALTPARFILIRYRRLFLPLAIGTTISFALVASLHLTAELAAAYAVMLAFLPVFWRASAFFLNVPAWSLFLEIVANALHGAILCRMRRLWLLFLACAAATVLLLSVGLARWGYGIGPIMSCLPREMCFYLAGIIAFRRWGDPRRALPDRFNGAASWAGAISYPLYATHFPVLWLFRSAGPVVSLAAALLLAFGVTILSERIRSRRQSSCRARPRSFPKWRLGHSP
jgi:peptidoglycan/LPS O-acetylase OafA/YrhL